MFKELLLKHYPRLDSSEILRKFDMYYNLLIIENAKYNLTAIREPEEIVVKHFYDSLIYNEYLNIKGDTLKVVDIGTGPGFPGLVLAILNPKSSFTLVDSMHKKVSFLKMVARELALENVEALNERSEVLGKKEGYREAYDLGVARSVAYLPTLSEYILPLIKVGGKMILTKEAPLKEELVDSYRALDLLGGKYQRESLYSLPLFNNSRVLLEFKKIQATPILYPRREGVPKKKPL